MLTKYKVQRPDNPPLGKSGTYPVEFTANGEQQVATTLTPEQIQQVTELITGFCLEDMPVR